MRIAHGSLLSALTLTAIVTGACTKGTPEEELREVITQVPWMLQMLQDCESYKKAKLDGPRADLSNNAVNGLRGYEVKGARAEVEKILPNRPDNPDEYSLQLTMGKGVRFASESKERPIRAGDPIFAQAAALGEGQCVIFSGDKLAPIAGDQMGKVCTPRYYIRLTELRPCPN